MHYALASQLDTARRKPLLVLLTLFVVLLVLPPPAPAAGPARIQPALLAWAAAHPHDQVVVIVQKDGQGNAPEALLTQLGGSVTRDLRIINAFAAQLRAGAAVQLARARGVRWVSLDMPVLSSHGPIDTSNLHSAFIRTIGADRVWNEGPTYRQGQGVTVAVIDSGDCTNCIDLRSSNYRRRVVAAVSTQTGRNGDSPTDRYGHGSLIEGLVGGNGLGSYRRYMGVAPRVNMVSVKVTDNQGQAITSDVVHGLEWVLQNKAIYNIRVVNISLNSSTAESYHTSPLAAAAEILWFNGIVVVASAGNNGTATLHAPANDPFVITVGATNDQGTPSLADDVVAGFSAYGITESGFTKPDLVAPGTNLVSILPRTRTRIWREHQSHYTGESSLTEHFMRVSGTSFAAPVVSGAIALLLQAEPQLTPDQVKYRLLATANKSWPGYNPMTAGAGILDIYAAVHTATAASANTGTPASQLLWTGPDPVAWDSVNWNSVNWNSVNWNSVNWNSVNWNSVNWNSDYWGS